MFFEIEAHQVYAHAVEKDDETFEEFSHRMGGAAPAGMMVFDDVALPYSRLIRIVKLED